MPPRRLTRTARSCVQACDVEAVCGTHGGQCPPYRPFAERKATISAGYSLVELLMVITLMSIAAALALPSVNPGIHDQLQGAAEIVAGDLAYARGLAVTNNGTYRFTFDLAHESYTLVYSGADPSLKTLPSNPFQAPGGDPTQYTVAFAQLPSLGGSVQLAAVGTTGTNPTPQTTIEFGPYGSTTQSAATVVWLSAGSGSAQRFILVSVNPVTGLATIGPFQGSGPPASILGAGS